jgi:hypothetical protein
MCSVGLWVHLFENDKGETLDSHCWALHSDTAEALVTAERYKAIPRNFLLSKLEAFGVLSNNLYFQQNGHSVNAARCIMEVFRYLFRRVISRFGDITQPAISPDLTVPDFTVWGYLKENVYSNRPYTIQEMKNAIRDEIATTNQGLFFDTFVNRWRKCVASERNPLSKSYLSK